jgi:hypothetical protein
MLTTVDLDDEPFFIANEIEDVVLERYLSSKLETLQTPVTQETPHY